MSEHFIYLTGDNKKDFIVFNSEGLSTESVTPADIEFIDIPRNPEIDSMVWSSNCRFYFVCLPIGLALLSTKSREGVLCRKKSYRFIEMFLDADLVKPKLADTVQPKLS